MSEPDPSRLRGALGDCLPRDLLLAARADAAPPETRERIIAALARGLASMPNELAAVRLPEGAESVPVSTSSGVFEKRAANAAQPAPSSGGVPAQVAEPPPLPQAELAEHLTWSMSPDPYAPARSGASATSHLVLAARRSGVLVRAVQCSSALPLAAAVLIGVLVGNGIYRLATLPEAERGTPDRLATVPAAATVPTDVRVVERPIRGAVGFDALGSVHPTGKGKRSLGGAHVRPAQPCAVATWQRGSEAAPRLPAPAGRVVARRAAREDWLGEQLALLARAERSLVDGDALLALRSVDEYAARFPGGMLDPQMAWLRERAHRTLETHIFP